MNCSGWSEKIDDYVDGALPPADATQLEVHLAGCADCRRALESLRALRAAAAALPREIAPPSNLWAGIESQLAQRQSTPLTPTAARPTERPSGLLHWLLPLAAAASIAAAFFVLPRPDSTGEGPSWTVASVSGAPRIARKTFQGTGRFHVGQWLETDRTARARVDVGTIGIVNVEPNSRLRLVDAKANDHRLELAQGELSALIWAPPRLFFVNTPSATAVDLGCAYTLNVDDEGNGTLHVTSGYVALEDRGRESIIPHGAKCATRRGFGPGTPFAADALAKLQAALARFDFGPAAGRSAAVVEVLRDARAEDQVTLWHLLGRVAPTQRGDVFDALAKFHPAPDGVTRAGIVAGDAKMREAWADKLGLRSF